MSVAAVSAGHTVTADVAENLLRDGANAFDALIGGFFAACVTEPILASAGGGAFMLARPVNQRARVLDAFAMTPGTTPSRHELDIQPVEVNFGDTQQTYHIGNGTVAVPGVVHGLFTLHDQLGHMPMRDIVAPAIELATAGVEIVTQQATILKSVAAIVSSRPGARQLFLNTDEAPLGEGERFTNPRFADFLETLAVEGLDFFYRGEVASALDLRRRSAGGCLSLEDLANYESRVRDPLEYDFSPARMLTCGAPSAGGMLVSFGLGLLEGMHPPVASMSTGERHATLVEVMRATAAARVHATVDGADVLDDGLLFGQPLVEAWRHEISQRAATFRGTTHLNVLDARGNIACMSTSNGEGSGEVLEDTGIMMNNMLGEDDLNPRGIGNWNPKSRMTSMMAPTLIQFADGRVIMMGSGGSNRIRTALLQVAINAVAPR